MRACVRVCLCSIWVYFVHVWCVCERISVGDLSVCCECVRGVCECVLCVFLCLCWVRVCVCVVCVCKWGSPWMVWEFGVCTCCPSLQVVSCMPAVLLNVVTRGVTHGGGVGGVCTGRWTIG